MVPPKKRAWKLPDDSIGSIFGANSTPKVAHGAQRCPPTQVTITTPAVVSEQQRSKIPDLQSVLNIPIIPEHQSPISFQPSSIRWGLYKYYRVWLSWRSANLPPTNLPEILDIKIEKPEQNDVVLKEVISNPKSQRVCFCGKEFNTTKKLIIHQRCSDCPLAVSRQSNITNVVQSKIWD